MSIQSKLTLTLAALAVSAPAFAQSKSAALNELLRLQHQVNQLASTNPELAAKLKQRAEDLRSSLLPTSAPLGNASNPAGHAGSNDSVAPNYSTLGPCGSFDSGTAGNTVFSASTNTPIPIADVATTLDTVVVGGLGTQTFDVDLSVAITHTWNSDLVITLISPAGTVCPVATNRGGSFDDVFNGTLFDDQSLNSVATYPYVDGVAAPDLRPEQSFNTKFRGENPNGIWTLSIQDVAAGDVGNLNAWSLSVTDGAILHVPPILGAPSNYSTGVISVPIFDLSTSTVPLVVSGGSTSLVQVQAYVEITHTWNSDLIISLQSPLGTIQDLSNRRGGSFDDVFNGTLFRMDSPNAIASYVFTNGVAAPDLQPDGDLTAFAGEDSNGTWNLIVSDNAGGDIGTIHRWDLNVFGCGAGSTNYCQGKINSLGCLPAIGGTGYSSASLGSGFVVSGTNLRNNKPTMLVYTDNGRANTPFFGGTLCVGGPAHRGLTLNSGGTAGPTLDCSGTYSVDMNAFAAGTLGGSPASFLLVSGTVVDAQLWARDPGFPVPNNASLTDGLEWTVGL